LKGEGTKKKFGYRVLLSLITYMGIFGLPVMAEEITEIHFVSEAWENVTHADGTGLCWELFRKVYEPRGIHVMFEIVPYARATNMVQQQQADVSVGVYLDEYDKALFSQSAVFRRCCAGDF
jgi:polar amino acid transport system substrate-binding protein